MSEQSELIYRVEAKKKELQAELASMKNDITDSAIKNKKDLEDKIKEMTQDLKNAGDHFSESVAKKFNDWLSI